MLRAMPDVVVVGGGIIGAACALELAERGASVTLIEREHLAAGASGRNLGLLVMPDHADLVPMYRASVDRYLRAVDESPFDVFMDRDSCGGLQIALEPEDMEEATANAAFHAEHGIRWSGSTRATPCGPSSPRSPTTCPASGTSTTAGASTRAR